MENFNHLNWAPFPEDNVTSEEFGIALGKLKSLGKLQEIRGLHSNTFSERHSGLYDFVDPIYKVVLATGRDVELPIVVPGKAKKIGREAAGFFRRVNMDLTIGGQDYSSITFITTVNGLTIGLLKDIPAPQVMLSISFPEREVNHLILVGQSLAPEQFIDCIPGDILDPEPLTILEKILISASDVLAKSTKI